MAGAFACSQFTTRPWPLERDVKAYASAGFTHIEVCEEKLDPERLEEQFALIARAGLAVCAVQPMVRTFLGSRMQPEPYDPQERFAALVGSIERLGPFAKGVPFIVNTGAAEDGDMASACAAWRAGWRNSARLRRRTVCWWRSNRSTPRSSTSKARSGRWTRRSN